MKKFYLSLSLLFIFFLSQAQINKGTILLGGNLEYGESSGSSNVPNSPIPKSNELSISPVFGKAIKDNLVLGFDITYGHNANSLAQQYNDNSDVAGAGFFIREYKLLGNGFYLFGEAGIGGSYTHNSTTDPGTPNSISSTGHGYTISLQAYPGIAYAINRKWQVEISLPNFFAVNYSHSKDTETITGQPDQTSTGNNLTAVSSLTGTNELSVGLRYLISRTTAR